MTPLNVVIGYDPRQPIAAQVLAHSIASNSSKPVAITRLQLSQLPIQRRGLTDFTYSRFLTPWIFEYEGYSAFIDSDFIVIGDITDLFAAAFSEQILSGATNTSVWVCKNKLTFEWPSLMLFRNENCRMLTPEYVDNPQSPLFRFEWAERVGELPAEWNFLVGYDAKRDALPKAIHYTQGIPCWPETQDCDYAEEWRQYARQSQSSVSFEELMGPSVHAAPVRKRLAATATAKA